MTAAGPCVILTDVFFSTPPAPAARIVALAAKLDEYACFSQGRNGGGGRPGRRAQVAGRRAARTERPRIGARELSRGDMCRKDFLGLMNKMSPQNYGKIWKAVATGLVPEHAAVYCDVLWSLMHRQSRLYLAMYAEVAWSIARALVAPHKMEFKAAWDEKWALWVGATGAEGSGPGAYWAVGAHQRALLATVTSSSEDDFNELLAWKKSRLCLAQACAYLCHKGILTHPPIAFLAPVVDAVAAFMEPASTPPPSYDFLDYYLDILIQCIQVLGEIKQPVPPVLLEKLTAWHAQSDALPSLCRFKILDVIENGPTDR